MKFLLARTPTVEYRVETMPDGQIKLSQQTSFTFADPESLAALKWFIQEVKADKSIRHTYTCELWHFEYEPSPIGDYRAKSRNFTITYRTNGRKISMALATAYKLLDALTGNTERLVKEEEHDV